MDSLRARLRRIFGWSTGPRAWRERAAALGLVLAALLGWLVARHWPVEGQVLVGALWLTLLALFLRHEVIRFVGPVFLYELLRDTRRYVHARRVVFAAIIFVVIGYVYVAYTLSSDRTLGLAEQASFAGSLFLTFFGTQMALIGVLTPAMIAGAIAEEKERRTLEFVLATDLTSREIVLGKLGARLAAMFLLVLAGMPVVALLQFFGGVDPGELLAMAIVSIVTLFSLAALSILMSTLLRRSRDAIVLTYGVMIAYVSLSALAEALRHDLAGINTYLAGKTISATDALDLVEAGNPFIGLGSVLRRLERGTAYADVLRDTVRDYTIFHLLSGAICLGTAVMRLRPVALGQSGESRGKKRRRVHGLPPIGPWPMAWKEVYAEPGLRLHIILRVLIMLIALGSFWPAVQTTFEHWIDIEPNLLALPFYSFERGNWWNDPITRFQREINSWVKTMSGLLGTLMLMSIAVRGAGSVTGEKARHTLDDLLTTPLSNKEIINGKWLGSLLSVRRMWLWLGMVYLIGLATGGINLLGLFYVLVAWFLYAVFFAAAGVWCSVRCRNTLEATVAAIIFAIVCLGGHWVFTGFCCYLPIGLMGRGGSGLGDAITMPIGFQAGLTPPFVFAAAPIQSMRDLGYIVDSEKGILVLLFMLPGPFLAAVAGLGLRAAAVMRFADRFKRTDFRRPERTKPIPLQPREAKD